MTPAARHPATVPVVSLLADCDERRTRRSGPGGQHRNKVETAVILTHRPTSIAAEASERRSQAENRTQALFRLRLALAVRVRTPVSLAAPPSPLWQSRCRGGRIAVNPAHDDYPALVAEALDRIAAAAYDLPAAAAALACTPSQLVKLLQPSPRGLELMNRERQARGLRPLR